jgi:protein-tyrosine-phosphatase
MAEAMFAAAAAGTLDVEVRSAGVAAGPGGPASRETVEVLKSRGIELTGFRSSQVDEEMLEAADHVFCMTRRHLEMLEMTFPEYRDRYHLVRDFDGSSQGGDVPDPIGQGRAAYEEVARCFDSAIEGILGFLAREGK